MRYKVYDYLRPCIARIVETEQIYDSAIKEIAISKNMDLRKSDFNNLKVRRVRQGVF